MLWGFFTGQPMTIVSTSEQTAHPKWLSAGEPHPYIANNRQIERYETFIDACEQRKAKTIGLHRSYALGDIMMLLPVVRALRRVVELDTVRIITRESYWRSLQGWDSQDDFEFWRWTHYPPQDYGCDIHIDLDSCLECDHWGGEESTIHRLALYGRALGLEVRPG